MLPRIFPRNDQQRRAAFEQSLIRKESEFGGTLFGPVPKKHKRQFFCLDKHTWIWHEEWVDKDGQQRSVTTRYVVQPKGIIKSQNGQAYKKLSANESSNLIVAAKIYLDHMRNQYNRSLQAF